VDPSGETTELGTVRATTVRAATNGSELFVVASVCDDGGEECDRDRALLWVLDGDGVEVDGVEIALADEESGSLGPPTIAGIADRDAWVATPKGVTRVSPEGEVVEEAPRRGGLDCVVDGRLFATTSPTASAPPDGPTVSPGPGPGDALVDPSGVAGGPGAEGPDPVDLTLSELVEGSWGEVEGATIPLAATADLTCTPVGIERFDHATGAAVPDAIWTPERGLVPVPAPEDAPAGLQGPPLPTPHGEQYLIDGEGRLLVRAAGSASFERRPGAGSEELRAASIPTYDASATLEVWCGTRAGDEPPDLTCRVSRR
jgi:hypothetical protein